MTDLFCDDDTLQDSAALIAERYGFGLRTDVLPLLPEYFLVCLAS